MDISTKLAQIIVTDMKKIINQDINFINTNGVILASTNTSRIGTFHGAGKKVSNMMDNLIIHYDGEYTGAKKGINLPLYFENAIVGVIGITGEREKVEQYGKIIKRMTELLINDAYTNKLKNKKRENQRMMIEELLFNDNKHNNNDLWNRIKVFDIEEDVPRFVIIAEFLEKGFSVIEEKEKVLSIFESKIANGTDNLMMQNRNNIIMVLKDVSRKSIEAVLHDIHYTVQTKLGLNLKFGIGTVGRKLHQIKGSYERARMALGWILASDGITFGFYRDMDIELIVENVSKDVGVEFKQKVLKESTEKDIEEYLKIIDLFEKFNGSINKIADTLFIHKNTLQYKLNNLYKKTGYDMRNYRDFAVLKMAFLMENVNNE